MHNCITNHKLKREIEHMTQYLPSLEELSGMREGSSYYRKVNESRYLEEFKKIYRHLTGLKDRYILTQEQCLIVDETKAELVCEVEKIFQEKPMIAANLGDYLGLADT